MDGQRERVNLEIKDLTTALLEVVSALAEESPMLIIKHVSMPESLSLEQMLK